MTRCAHAQVVVSVNPKAALPKTTVEFSSPTEASALLVESGLHFGGRLVFVFKGATVGSTYGVRVSVWMDMSRIGYGLQGYTVCMCARLLGIST